MVTSARGKVPTTATQRTMLTCEIDGTTFAAENGVSTTGTTLYCSEECAQEAAESSAW